MSSTDIELMVKEANILGRIARGGLGALKSAPKGALVGGALGTLAAPFAGLGLAGALGVGGAGAFGGAMTGGSMRGLIGGLRAFLKNPEAENALVGSGRALANQAPSGASALAKMAPAAAIGGGLGYALSDEHKGVGTALGVAGGLLARPAIMRALAARRGA
jgi:hypothetical protein